MCLSGGSSTDGHVGLQTRCSIAVGWLTCPVGFCSLLNHLTKEKGEGQPSARLPAAASSGLQHQLLGGFDQEFVAAQGFLLFLCKCLMKGRPRENLAPSFSGTQQPAPSTCVLLIFPASYLFFNFVFTFMFLISFCIFSSAVEAELSCRWRVRNVYLAVLWFLFAVPGCWFMTLIMLLRSLNFCRNVLVPFAPIPQNPI